MGPASGRGRQRGSRRCAVALGIWLSTACPAGLAQNIPQTYVSVAGQVTTERDQAISSGVRVSVQSADGLPIAEGPADSQGRFQMDNILSGKKPYQLIVKAEGYYPVQQSLDLRAASGVVTVQVVLTRVSKAQGTDNALPALTDMSAPRKARKAYDKGVRALDVRRLPEAQRDFTAAVAEYPCYARAQTSLAAILMSKRDLQAAEAALRKAVQCDPGFSESFVWLGRVLNSEKRFTESEAALEQGLRASPKAWALYDELASAHYNQGLYAQATDEWLRAEALNPEAPSELHAKLAAAYLQQGNPDKAYAEMQTYLRSEPGGRFSAQARSLMRQIEASSSATASPKAQPSATKH